MTSATASSTAPIWSRISSRSTRRTPTGRSPTACYSKVDTEASALPRIRDLVGQPGAAQCRRDAVDRRRAVHRQQAHHRPGILTPATEYAHRPAQHQLADRRVLLMGRQHHARAAGARLDHRPLRARARASSPTARPSSTRPTRRRPAISASSCRARWRLKEHAEFTSCMDMIDLMPPGLYEAVITEVAPEGTGQSRADPRPLPVPARAPHPGRHSRLRQQRRRGRPPLRHHGAAVGGQSRACIAPSPSRS